MNFSHGDANVIVNLRWRIGFLIQDSETFRDIFQCIMDSRDCKNGVLNITNSVVERSYFVRTFLVIHLFTNFADGRSGMVVMPYIPIDE